MYNPNELRDDHGRWTSGGVVNEFEILVSKTINKGENWQDFSFKDLNPDIDNSKSVSYTKDKVTSIIKLFHVGKESEVFGIKRRGQKYTTVNGKVKRVGFWLDWPEDNWKLTREQYYNKPKEERMMLEVKEQHKYNLKKQFKGTDSYSF